MCARCVIGRLPVASPRVGKVVGLWALIAVLLAGMAAPAGAQKPVRTALFYGDSITWESSNVVNQTLSAKGGWIAVHREKVATAPCDWPSIAADIAKYHPASVVIETAGNATACTGATATQSYYSSYQSTLRAMFTAAAGAGSAVVFVEAPPIEDPSWESAVEGIDTIAVSLAHQISGVSISTAGRSKLSKNGHFVTYKKCLKGETASEGCTNGQIAIRTHDTDSAQDGLHLCPDGLNGFPWFCDEYSSGELRFGQVLAKAATHPPKPVIP